MMKAMLMGVTFELDGAVYSSTEKGYCYKSTGKKDKKGQDIMVRISKAAFEQAFEQYTSLVNEADEEQDEFDTAYEERQEMAKKEEERQAGSDKQAEEKVNKKESNDGVEITSMWDGDTYTYTLKVNGEVKLRAYSYKECEEEAKKYRKPASKTSTKKRTSKNAFHTSTAVPGMTLTDKQVSFMLHLPDTSFWENGLDSALWVDVLVDEIGGEFTEKPMTVGAMVSTLREKGILEVGVDRINGKKAKYIVLTEDGKKVAKELGMK